MKYSLSWIKDHLDTNSTVEELAEKITNIGLEVEEIHDPAKEYEGVIVAHVDECEKHPDADRLRLCKVNTGNEVLQVVCGAPNVRQGIKICFAPVGTAIPSWPEDSKILKQGVIRGKESNGMCCSEAELGISEESDGIMELETDAPLGTPFAQAMGFNDPVIEIELTANRIDCAGVRGVARDLHAAGMGTLVDKPFKKIDGTYDSPITVKFDFKSGDENACPVFYGRYIRGVKNAPSPKWLQDRLSSVGIKSISALVDITNYLSHDRCRPLHVFDADKLSGNLTVRLSNDGERIMGLDEKEYTLDNATTVIVDGNSAQAMGGIMGGLDSSVSEDTVNIFIESAYFDPSRTRTAAKKLKIESDAKYRFERGIDKTSCEEGVEEATRLVLELCGGEPSNVTITGEVPEWKRTIEYNPSRTEKIGGMFLHPDSQKKILEDLGFDVEVKGEDSFTLVPPSWRNDIDGRADIVEEIIRIHGFKNIQTVSMKKEKSLTEFALDSQMKVNHQSRYVLAGRGMNETVTYSFTSEKQSKAFSYEDKKIVRVSNPISADLSVMRHSVLAQLTEAVSRNAARGLSSGSLFEMGSVFFGYTPDEQPFMSGGVRFGQAVTKTWGEDSRDVDMYDVKADVMAVLKHAGLSPDNVPVSRDAPHWYHPGRSGTFRLGKNVLAHFGELHPALLEEFEIDVPVMAFEIFMQNIPQKKQKTSSRPKLTLSVLQPVNRDFAFIVDKTVDAGKLIRAAQTADKKLISDVRLFDVYQGKGVNDGMKSMAISVTLQPMNDTLTDADIEGVSQKIIANVEKQTGGSLRG